jgi:hypothetical protein
MAVWGGGIGRVVLLWLWKRRGESFGWSRRDGRRAGVEEAGASHPSSEDSGSEAGRSNASGGNGAGGHLYVRAPVLPKSEAAFYS